MTDREIIRGFRLYAGQEKYRQFLFAINNSAPAEQRLKFWQEHLWAEFVKKNPGHDELGTVNVLQLFRICPVHGCRMAISNAGIRYGKPSNMYLFGWYAKLRDALFPFGRMSVLGGCMVGPESVCSVIYCRRCRLTMWLLLFPAVIR
jgi:hypothetical protein